MSDDAANKRQRTVREFVSEFKGLSGSAKVSDVLTETGLQRAQLSDLLGGGKGFDEKLTSGLLRAMQGHSKPVPPSALGVLGRDHLYACCRELGCEMESFAYKKFVGTDSNRVPCIVEAAFVWRGDVDDSVERRLITGVNWSAAIGNPFRMVGRRSLDDILNGQECEDIYPIIVILHVAYPVATHTDRGESAVAGDIINASPVIPNLIESVTKRWAKQIKREQRDDEAQFKREQALTRSAKTSIKDVAWEVMEAAYLKASAKGTLPALARQIMYAARPKILGSDRQQHARRSVFHADPVARRHPRARGRLECGL